MGGKRYFLNALVAGMMGGLLLPGCRALREGRTVAATDDVPRGRPSAEQLEVGRIAFVRGTAKPPFVLIKTEPGISLPDKARLEVLSSDGSVAHLRTTAQRSEGFHVANIDSGRPRQGDRVVMRYPKGDGTDPVDDDEDEWGDIPPLLRPGGRANANSSSDFGSDSTGRAGPETTAPDGLPDVASPSLLDHSVPMPTGPPETTDDVEPRAPTRETDPLELPVLEKPPDEGDDFVAPLPER